jgi:hypothetical protein
MTNSVALTASNFTLSTAQAPEGNRNNISEGESKTSSCSKKRLRSSGEAENTGLKFVPRKRKVEVVSLAGVKACFMKDSFLEMLFKLDNEINLCSFDPDEDLDLDDIDDSLKTIKKKTFTELCFRTNGVASRWMLNSMSLIEEKRLKVDFEKGLALILKDSSKLSLEEMDGYISSKNKDLFQRLKLELSEAVLEVNNFRLSLLDEQLIVVKEVGKLLIEALRDESKIPHLIDLCSKEYIEQNPSSNQRRKYLKYELLFVFLDYIALDAFQIKYFEPFNIVFPKISLQQAPITVKQLKFVSRAMTEVDLSRFRNLRELSLSRTYYFPSEKFNAISNKKALQNLELLEVDVKGFDFSEMTNLERLKVVPRDSLSPLQFNNLPNQDLIKEITLTGVEGVDVDFSKGTLCLGINYLSIKDFNFSKFTKLESLTSDYGLTLVQFNQIPNKEMLKEIKFHGVDVTGFDFSKCIGLEVLDLNKVRGLIATQFNAIPNKASIKKLCLNGLDAWDFEFFEFVNLEYLDLSDSKGVLAWQFNLLPNKGKITELYLRDVCCLNFEFSGFFDLRVLDLDFLGDEDEDVQEDILSLHQANIVQQFSEVSKWNIEVLTLKVRSFVGFNFTYLAKIKSLSLNGQSLTAEQFTSIPKEFIEILDVSEMDVTGFNFSGFPKLRNLNLKESQGFTSGQLRSISNKKRIRHFNLNEVGVWNFNFRGFTGLKSLYLEDAEGLDVDVAETIPNRENIEGLDLDYLYESESEESEDYSSEESDVSSDSDD